MFDEMLRRILPASFGLKLMWLYRDHIFYRHQVSSVTQHFCIHRRLHVKIHNCDFVED